MRIGMVLDSIFPHDSRVEKEAISLIEAGHEVFLFSLNYTNKPNSENYKGIKICRFPAGKITYKLSAIAYPFPFYKWLLAPHIRNFLENNNIEIVHVHDMVIADAALSVSRDLPVVVDFHENRPEIMRDYMHVKKLSGRILININIWKKQYYELANKASHVVVVTDLAKKDILANTNKNSLEVSVVPNTIMKSEFLNYPIKPDIQNRMAEGFNVLYIGDTSIRRGTRTAIQAAKILQETIPNLKLWLVGAGSADVELKALIKELDLTMLIQMEGWQDFERLPSYIQFCQVALSPLLRNVHHDTTYANKIFQYMALGKPLVVSDCTAQAALVKGEDCGLIHVANNPESLADCIAELFNNPAKALEFGLNGKRSVFERWNWENTVSTLIEGYRSLSN
jgi:glycosyltransferase involved in cell wall biosynthesis